MPALMSPRSKLLPAAVVTLCFLLLLACGSGAKSATPPKPTEALANPSTAAPAVRQVMQVPAGDTPADPLIATEGAVELPPQARVTTGANVRTGPNVAFERISTIPADTVVDLVSVWERDGERWYEVQAGEVRGWMSNTLLAFEPGVAERVLVNTTPWNIPQPTAVPTDKPAVPAQAAQECDPSYPDVCIPPRWQVGDLDCPDIADRRFAVVGADPHGFDGDNDGIGCER